MMARPITAYMSIFSVFLGMGCQMSSPRSNRYDATSDSHEDRIDAPDGECGNGVIEGREQCDGTNMGGQSCESLGYEEGTLSCSSHCQLDANRCVGSGECGNGILDSGEQCDDANETDWDGCNDCMIAEFLVNTTTEGGQNTPSIALVPDGKFIIAWGGYYPIGEGRSIFAQRFDRSGVRIGPEFRLNQTVDEYHVYPELAISPDGWFVAVWVSDHCDIFGQIFDSAGSPTGPILPVNDTTMYCQGTPSVAIAPDGRFTAVWDSTRPIDSYNICGRHFEPSGLPIDVQFFINTNMEGHQDHPSIAMVGDGRFVVVWESWYQDGSGRGIFGQRFGPDGLRIGSEFLVNSIIEEDQETPSVAISADGGFVVAWETNPYWHTDPSVSLEGDIWARMFDWEGTPVGSDFLVNTNTVDDQSKPCVAMANDGRFVVVWDSMGQDGDSTGVYGQRYDPGGSKTGTEFLVNTYVRSGQHKAKIAMSPSGDFVVVWQSQEQDGDSSGIFAQRYDADGNPLGVLPR